MKVLHIISGISKESGGPARSSQGLVASLRRAGVDAVLVSCKVGDAPWLDGVDRFHAPEAGGLKSLKSFFVRVMREERPDLVHLHGIWQMQNHLAAVTARKFNIPYIITPRGMLEPWSLQQKKWKKWLAMWLYQRKDLNRAVALHATAASEAGHFKELGFKNKVLISPNGVDFSLSLPHKKHVDEKKRVLFVGRMRFNKGVLELVEAWNQVKPKNWCCELVYTMAREDEYSYEKQVRARVKELGLEDFFVFTGALMDDAKWDAYRRADLFVLPTYSENFGIVVAEALYAELPVVTTKGAPWAELEEFKCGKWIDQGVPPLVVALKEMMSLSDESRSAMGKSGCRLMEERYSWSSIAKKMVEEYRKLLEFTK